MNTRVTQDHSGHNEPQSQKTSPWPCRKFVFLCLASLSMGSPTITCFAASSPSQSTEAKSTMPGRIEIPFDLYNDNLVIVKATVGQAKNVNMILDTGTSPSAISHDLANRLKLRGNSETLVTLNGVIPTQSVVVPHFQVGPLRAESVRVVVQDLDFMEKSLGISIGGVIGIDVLASGCLTIDYKKRKIVFGPIDKNEKTVPFETMTPFLTVRASIEGQQFRLLVDSGVWGVLVFHNRLRLGAEKVNFDSNTSIESPGGKTRVGWIRAQVFLGQARLAVSQVAIADGDPGYGDAFDGLFGFGKVGLHRVSFDFENGLFGWD